MGNPSSFISSKKRGRPKNNAGYFSSFHRQPKRPRVHQELMDEPVEDFSLLKEEAENIENGCWREGMPIKEDVTAMVVYIEENTSFNFSFEEVVVLPFEVTKSNEQLLRPTHF